MKKASAYVLYSVLIFITIPQSYAFDFSQGHFYATPYNSRSITEYSPSGAIVDTLTVPSLSTDQYLRGLVFGPDGLLYATVGQQSNFKVLAINSSGNVQQTYMHTGTVGGNISFGKIGFDNSGHFYVGDGAGIVRFNTGAPLSGSRFSNITSGVYDINTMPNGNMLVITNNDLLELDSSGNQIRNISNSSATLTSNRGIEYDPATNVIYLSMLGSSSLPFRILKLDGATGQMLDNEYFWYADDLWLTEDGKLIAASRTQSPGMFNTELGYLGSFEGPDQMFVTQYAVPEPATILTFIAGLGLLFSSINTNSRIH